MHMHTRAHSHLHMHSRTHTHAHLNSCKQDTKSNMVFTSLVRVSGSGCGTSGDLKAPSVP